ncbi:hypothetical protein C8R47DRAFT_1323159 [Mycena vitilis]|nr:hypothetical protein C8R47DRAFT_1323159 [Mycena vitilis]
MSMAHSSTTKLVSSTHLVLCSLNPHISRETLSFYFESESERRRTAIWLCGLGINITAAESSEFASSLFNWPLFDDAILCLRSLQPYIPGLVALVELDAETLCKTAAYRALGGYFREIFIWDQSKLYRPNVDGYDPPLIYHDNCGIPMEQRLHVSSALRRDLELVAEADIATVWMRCPGSLAADVPVEDASSAWKVCETPTQLVLRRRHSNMSNPVYICKLTIAVVFVWFMHSLGPQALVVNSRV